MGKKDIKIGETYYVRVKVTAISENRFVCRPLLWNGTMSDFAPNFFNFAEAEAFYESKPETTPPKYDPNRKFRKGDIVKPCQVKGRWQSITWEGRSGIHFTVTEDEDEDGIISIKDPDCKLPYNAAAVFFELVTPVEELEPYTISEGAGIIEVYNEKREAVKAWFYSAVKAGVKALAEAEAERDRLNTEWRKEQNDG